MSLASYIMDAFLKEEDVIKELLTIDNQVCMTTLTYDELYKQLNDASPLNDLNYDCVMLTDGDPDTVYEALVNNACNILSLHIDNSFLGINKWLVNQAYKYYGDQDISLKLTLDETDNYSKYKGIQTKIVIYGFDEFAFGTKELFDGQDVLIVSR